MQTSKASVDVVLRQAGAADAAGLAAHAELTFRLAWSAFNRQQDMDDYCGEHFTPDAVAADLASEGVRVVLAESEGALVGYLKTVEGAPCLDLPATLPIEIARCYVTPAWHGRGVAEAMMLHTLKRARESGCDLLWLAVWEQAPRARAFYARHGFSVVGRLPFQLGQDLQEDLVVARRP
ncbi:MAG: GNAT family N-acetyltransferase [Steroidobacteraceae bacterium]|jgi:ribosomal protein S18 acetylase RimI-like enzyme